MTQKNFMNLMYVAEQTSLLLTLFLLFYIW